MVNKKEILELVTLVHDQQLGMLEILDMLKLENSYLSEEEKSKVNEKSKFVFEDLQSKIYETIEKLNS